MRHETWCQSGQRVHGRWSGVGPYTYGPIYMRARGVPLVATKIDHKTMKIEAPEAAILRTPIKIEKLSLRNSSGGRFIMNFEFHGFQKKF